MTGHAQTAMDAPFRTDHLVGDLERRSVRAGGITIAAQVVKPVIQIGSTMALARLLAPADFGLIAMVTAVTGCSAMFKEAGLSMATIQRAEVTHAQVSTLFWINVALSVLIMAVLMALAPAIAWLYSEPQLIWVTIAVAGTILFGGLVIQHEAILKRQMRFGRLAMIDIASMAAGIPVGVGMAFAGFGCWSLVGMMATTAMVSCALVWIAARWRPGRFVRGSGVRSMLAFGAHLTGSRFMEYINQNVASVLIGWALGPMTLGFYSKAYSLLLMPMRQINWPLSAVAIPSFSRLQNEPERFRAFYLRVLQSVCLLAAPVIALSFADADRIILFVLGNQWMESVSLFRWLAPAALIGTLHAAPGWLMVSLGHPRKLLRWSLLSTPLTVIAIAVGIKWGADGVAAALSIMSVVLFLPMSWYATRNSPVPFPSLLNVLWRPIAMSLAAAVVLMQLREPMTELLILPVQLVLDSIVFMITFLLVGMILPGGRAMLGDAVHLFGELRRKRTLPTPDSEDGNT